MKKQNYYFFLSIAFICSLWSNQNSIEKDQLSFVETMIIGEIEIRLDGRLDEEEWKLVAPASNFIQQDPIEGMACTEKTEVYILYNNDNLYFGIKLFDSDPSGILAYQKRRDASLRTDDRFMWILDTFQDGRTGYFFEINPKGLMGDAILGSGGRWNINKSWDGIWDARVIVNEEGWSAEIEIPLGH